LEIIILLSLLAIIALLSTGVVATLKHFNNTAHPAELITGVLYFFSLILFTLGLLTHNNPYYQAIDPVGIACYSPFSDKHALTLLFYCIAFNSSLFLVWTKSKNLPPLTLTLSLLFILIGIILNIVVLLQISVHDISNLYRYNSRDDQLLFFFAPVLSILIGTLLIIKVMIKEINIASDRIYSNKYLNFLNSFLATKSKNPVWIALLLFPLFFIVTLVLILFGQDINSIVKVFTDTTTWKFSQQMHPPLLDHRGHYLCTIAATGNPKIVKPLRFGLRNGNPIIVNRQLLIANAFEEMICDFSPKLHSIIRTTYDTYGYSISGKINTVQLSNLTYILMKPLEWFFLICLYLFCTKPEQRINKQYTV
jgi:hypothetical protein